MKLFQLLYILRQQIFCNWRFCNWWSGYIEVSPGPENLFFGSLTAVTENVMNLISF